MTSIRTTSGRSSSAAATPSAPSDGLPHDLDVVLDLQEGAQAAADDLVVVDEQDADRPAVARAAGPGPPDPVRGRPHGAAPSCQPPGTSISISGALAGRRLHGELAADAAGAVAHRDQAEVAAGPADPAGVETAAVVGDPQQRALAVAGQGRRRRAPRPECRRALCSASWATRSSGLLLGGGQGADAVGREGDARGVGAVQDLDLGAQGGDQAVLVQGGGAQLDDGGAQFVGGLRGERGDLVQFVLGAGRVAVDQGGGGLGGQAQGEELLADGVVQFVGEPGALLGDGEFAAALVEAGVGEGDRGVLGEDRRAAPRRPR